MTNERPRFEFVRVQTSVYKDGEHKGDTILSFYNGKLMSVWFYAENWKEYKKFLKERRGIDALDNSWEKKLASIHVWVTQDYKGKYYIAWEDIYLSEAMNSWLRKYS